jgi:SAM-dependent methyltransferase
MKESLLEILRCPKTGASLDVVAQECEHGEIRTGDLFTEDRVNRYPVRDFIPRFVPTDNYASSFGLQWNRFRRTQLDSVSGVPSSRDRFYGFSQWSPAELSGKRVLDVGCGAGRFAEIALEAGAQVVAVDYSLAADACLQNLSKYSELEVIQGDIFALPFEPAQFDYVYCFGVLQHTPDVEAAFFSLPPQLKNGGKLAVDVYPWLLRNALWSKYWLRPLTRRIPARLLFRIVDAMTPSLLSVSGLLSKVPRIGHFLKYAVPVVDYSDVYPLSKEQNAEWALLDTFDMLAPAHDHPQKQSTLKRWFVEAGLENCTVERRGFLVGRGMRSVAAQASALQ